MEAKDIAVRDGLYEEAQSAMRLKLFPDSAIPLGGMLLHR
jgi:hypothetical protein